MKATDLIILSNPHELYQAFLETLQAAVKDGKVRGVAIAVVLEDNEVYTNAALSKGEPVSNLVFGLEKLKLKLLNGTPLF
jgi:hypothetical protein